VVRPDPKTKAEWLAKVQDLKTALPFSRVRVAMDSLYPVEQRALAEASAAERLKSLPAVDKTAGPVYMRSFAGMIGNCTPAVQAARIGGGATGPVSDPAPC
jgi:aminopeptidase N